MRVFLSGPMGSGKSTVARALAARLRVDAVDLDAAIESAAGKPIRSVFEQQGEAGFRELERATLERVLADDARVIALGGGTVMHEATRRRLLGAGVVVTLAAPTEELVRRVGTGEGRPLLAGSDIAARVSQLLAERASAYAECHAAVQTAGKSLAQIADEVASTMLDAPIVVPLGERTYRVEVGAGVRVRVPARVATLTPSASVLVISDETVGPLWGDAVSAELARSGLATTDVRIPAGEAHKHIRTVESIWDAALDAGLDRGSALVGVGGGVVGDLAGFAAATLLRGMPIGHMPTTLLAMVDSAVGGKTGFDTRHGKNLVGAFHQPGFVLCDTDVLATLPLRERRAGLAEVVKSAWIASEAAVAALERDADELIAGDTTATCAAIRMAAGLKARVVTEDEREGGYRAVLNLGHTVGHAIEAAAGYTGFLHGEAVALGMVAAMRLSQRFGHGQAEHERRLQRLLQRLGLPTDLESALSTDALPFLGSDKKRRGGSVTLVLPAEPGDVVLRKVDLREVERALFGTS